MKKTIIALLISIAIAQTSYAASDTIFMETYEKDGDLVVEVKSLDMTISVIGTAFDIYYDPYALSYKSYEEGGFFEQGGEPIYMVAESVDANGKKIISGITLKRTDQQVSTGDMIITFYFDILKRENTKFKFDHSVISTLEDGKRIDLTNIEWIDSEMNLEPQEIIEETPKATIQNYETTSGTGSPDEQIKNYTSVFTPETIVAGLLPIALGICYISFRYYKKKYAKKTDTCITKPEKKEPACGAWTEI